MPNGRKLKYKKCKRAVAERRARQASRSTVEEDVRMGQDSGSDQAREDTLSVKVSAHDSRADAVMEAAVAEEIEKLPDDPKVPPESQIKTGVARAIQADVITEDYFVTGATRSFAYPVLDRHFDLLDFHLDGITADWIPAALMALEAEDLRQ